MDVAEVEQSKEQLQELGSPASRAISISPRGDTNRHQQIISGNAGMTLFKSL